MHLPIDAKRLFYLKIFSFYEINKSESYEQKI